MLAEKLSGYRGSNALLLALPRGGVAVAYEVAVALDLPLDVFVVRKLGLPGQPELAIGAVATGGVRVINEEAVQMLAVPEDIIETATAVEKSELERRERAYRGSRPPPQLSGRTVILIDDGLATGSTMLAAARAARQQQPLRIVVAVPVGTPEACDETRSVADEVVCAVTPQPFFAVGAWYRNFAQLSDEDVMRLLEQARQRTGRPVS